MAFINEFLAIPLVALTGYILTVVSGAIAIFQYREKSSALKQVNNLKMEIKNLQAVVNQTNVTQGDKSQYFPHNSGPVSIDNRG